MAVEAHHMNLYSRTNSVNRDNHNMIEATSPDMNYNLLQIRYGVPMSRSDGLDTTTDLLPMYSSGISDSHPPLTPFKSDDGRAYKGPEISRKRPRDCAYGLIPNTSFSLLGEDISLQIQRQQLDVDRIIAQHTEKVRLEIEETRKNQTRRILEVIEERLLKRLRIKDEEIQKMVKFNYTLEQRMGSLCVENQIWCDLAQTNEATANALRTNLEHVLCHVKRNNVVDKAPLMEDAQSYCDSCDGNEIATTRDRRWCRHCEKEEARVLLLPCRHLCLCGVCGSSVHTCPVCKSVKTASVHVNIS